jgi:hypothetical protein
MLNEKKGTCCHRCGHVHVKGTSCPKPFLKGERSCARRLKEDDYDLGTQSGDTDAMGDINEKRLKEMHTMDDDGHDEFHQVRADVEESLKGLWASIKAKRERGEKPAKKGSEVYNKAAQAAKKINAMNEIGPIERLVREIQAENRVKNADYEMGEFEALAANRSAKNTIKESANIKNPYVKALVEECDRLIKILRNDELFEKERQKYKK